MTPRMRLSRTKASKTYRRCGSVETTQAANSAPSDVFPRGLASPRPYGTGLSTYAPWGQKIAAGGVTATSSLMSTPGAVGGIHTRSDGTLPHTASVQSTVIVGPSHRSMRGVRLRPDPADHRAGCGCAHATTPADAGPLL